MKLKKGDNVIIITGKDKGKKGKIAKAMPKDNKVIVEGLNMYKKHMRPRRQGEKGTTVELAMPIHASNVMVLDPKSGKPSKIGKKKVGDKFVRVLRKSNQEI
jgi:large subunit ribosomal protein L24